MALTNRHTRRQTDAVLKTIPTSLRCRGTGGNSAYA